MSVAAIAPKSPLAEVLNRLEDLETPDLELALRAAAHRLARRKLGESTGHEAELLEKINLAALGPSDRVRYRFLYEKLQNEAIFEAEKAELDALIERQEQQNVERLRALVELAALRGTSIDDLMKSLGIKSVAEHG
jgi:hypothetical protein